MIQIAGNDKNGLVVSLSKFPKRSENVNFYSVERTRCQHLLKAPLVTMVTYGVNVAVALSHCDTYITKRARPVEIAKKYYIWSCPEWPAPYGGRSWFNTRTFWLWNYDLCRFIANGHWPKRFLPVGMKGSCQLVIVKRLSSAFLGSFKVLFGLLLNSSQNIFGLAPIAKSFRRFLSWTSKYFEICGTADSMQEETDWLQVMCSFYQLFSNKSAS